MVRSSRLLGLFAAFAVCSALCLGALAGPAAGLSDAEYREMVEDPDFAKSDKRLNEVWSGLLKEGGLSKAGIRVLKADQAQWVRKGRDTQAKILKEGGSTALEAYTAATRLRADELPGIARRIFLQDRPDGPQGYYVQRTYMDYKIHADNGSTYNTPPCFSVYVAGEVFKHKEERRGKTTA